MADDEDPSGGAAEDEALHEQSRAQLERLANDPKAQELLRELEQGLAPGEDPAFWDVKKKARRPAPPSELTEHHDHVQPVAAAKPAEEAPDADKVVLSPEAVAANVIAELAAEAGMALEDFKQLPRGDPALKTAVSARRLADAERTVAGTARLERPAGLGEAMSAELADRVRDDGFDPTSKTVGGRTERGLPVPGEIGDEANEPAEEQTSAAPDREPVAPAASAPVADRPQQEAGAPEDGRQQRTMLLLGVAVIVVIGLVWFVTRQPPRGIVGAEGQPSATSAVSGDSSATGQAPAPSLSVGGPAAPSDTVTEIAPSAAPEPSRAPSSSTAPSAPAGVPTRPTATATATPPLPSKPRPPTHGPPRPTGTSGLYPDI